MKSYIITVVLISIFIFSCKKDYKPNINSTISGRFYDSTNKESYAHLALMVNEYQSHFNGYFTDYNLVNHLATGTTDANGNYTISFSTQGKGNYVFLEWGNTPSNVQIVNNNDKIFPNGNKHSKLINNIGGSNIYNANVSRQYYLQIRVIVSNNPAPFVFLNASDATFDRGVCNIFGKNNDTIIYVPITKNNGGVSLIFGINGPQAQQWLYNPAIMLNPVLSKDTTQGGTFSLFPATFK